MLALISYINPGILLPSRARGSISKRSKLSKHSISSVRDYEFSCSVGLVKLLNFSLKVSLKFDKISSELGLGPWKYYSNFSARVWFIDLIRRRASSWELCSIERSWQLLWVFRRLFTWNSTGLISGTFKGLSLGADFLWDYLSDPRLPDISSSLILKMSSNYKEPYLYYSASLIEF